MIIAHGIESTLEDAQNQRRIYLKSVGRLKYQKGVLTNYPRVLRRWESLGHLKQSLNIRTNGRTGESPMTSKAARGFLMLSLNSEQRERIHRRERELPEGRYLLPCEISSFFKTETGTKTDEQIAIMENLENEWNRLLWKQRKLEDLKELRWKTAQEEWEDWDNFAISNYDDLKVIARNDY